MRSMNQAHLYTKINALPNDIKSEVMDFIEFLLTKKNKEIKKRVPKFGSAKGQIYISSDFDEPLDDFKEYMK